MSDNKPKPIPRKTPGGSSSGGKKLTMREQIAARKQAESGGESSAPAAKAAPKAAPKAASKPAGKKASPVKRAAAAPAKAAASADKARPARSGARSGAGAKRGGAAKGRRGAAAEVEEGDDNGGTTRGRRGRPEPKKKSPVPMIATAVVVLGGAGAYFGGVFDSSPAEAADNGAETTDAAGTDVDTASIGVDAGADAPTESDSTDAGDSAATPEVAAAADAPKEDPTVAASKEEAKEAAKAKAEAERAERLDLSGLMPFGKPEEATAEEWATLQEKASEYFDPFAGAAGGRAEKKLIEAGKIAWPAILNELIKIDPEDPEQNRMGFRATLALSKARGSDTPNGFDWRSAQNSATGEIKSVDLYYNQRLIKVLYEGWAQVLEDPAHWAKYDKTEVSAEAAAKAKAKVEAAAKESGEFDDLDIPDID